MAELKTKATNASVDAFLETIADARVRADCRVIASLMEKATGAKPKMWGSSIIGFGDRRYRYPDGREMDWMEIAFSPRKQNITLYLTTDFDGGAALLEALGPYSCGKSCVYVKRVADLHLPTLKKLIAGAVRHVRRADA